jgi:hypothetical protein
VLTAEVLLVIGAVFHLGIAIFHMLFARIFGWSEGLSSMGFINRQLMPVMNHCLRFGFLAVAFLSVAFRGELLSSSLGHAVLVLVALFWVWRAVLQVMFFRLKHWVSYAFLVLFAGAASLYGYVSAIAL